MSLAGIVFYDLSSSFPFLFFLLLSHPIHYRNQTLLSAGYHTAGIDEGWEGCGQGVNGTQHDAQGNPVINSKFPDMQGLVNYG